VDLDTRNQLHALCERYKTTSLAICKTLHAMTPFDAGKVLEFREGMDTALRLLSEINVLVGTGDKDPH